MKKKAVGRGPTYVRRALELHEMTQAELCRRIEWSPANLCAWKSGRRWIPVAVAKRIESVIGVPAYSLIVAHQRKALERLEKCDWAVPGRRRSEHVG